MRTSAVTPYVATTAAVLGVAGLIEAIVYYGDNVRGLGSLFWLVVVWSAVRFGLTPAIWAAIAGTAAMDFSLLDPRHSIDLDAAAVIAFAALLIVAFFLGGREQARALTILPRFWNEPETGNYWEDCANGERRAQEFLRVLQARREGFMLGLMARDMIARGRYGGVEVGFFHRISLLLSGHDILPVVTAADHDAQNLGLEQRIIEAEDEVVPLAIGQK